MADKPPALNLVDLISLVQGRITRSPDASIREQFMLNDLKTANFANKTGTEQDKREAAAALRGWL